MEPPIDQPAKWVGVRRSTNKIKVEELKSIAVFPRIANYLLEKIVHNYKVSAWGTLR